MRSSASVFLILLMAGCAARAPTTNYEPEPDRTYDASTDEVWNAVLETFTDLEIPIENMERASGFIRSGYMDASSAGGPYLDCGEIWLGAVNGGWVDPASTDAAPSDIRVTLLVRDDGGEGTSVRFRENGGSYSYEGKSYSCEPTGNLSEAFFQQFEDRMGG